MQGSERTEISGWAEIFESAAATARIRARQRERDERRSCRDFRLLMEEARRRPPNPERLGLERLACTLNLASAHIGAYRGVEPPKEPCEAIAQLSRYRVTRKAELVVDFIGHLSNAERAREAVLFYTGGSSSRRAVHLKEPNREDAINVGLLFRLASDFGVASPREYADLCPRYATRESPIEALAVQLPTREGTIIWKLRTFDRHDRARAEEYHVFSNRRIDFIFGAPSRLHRLLEFCATSGFVPSIAFVAYSYEAMGDYLRSSLACTLRCPVVGIYGSTELGVIGWTCVQGRYHFEIDWCWPEFLKPTADEPAQPGEVARIVITSLKSRIMPMIRYDTEDFGIQAPDPCPCGREGPTLVSLEGRLAGMVVLQNGTLVSPFVLLAQLDKQLWSPYQAVQVRPGCVEIHVEVLPGQDEQRQAAESLAEVGTLRNNLSLTFCRASAFHYTASGKFHQFVSELDVASYLHALYR
jgi:phenylacetate-coenzyme A ligase PaaK-like adenylate-forming protein